MQKMFILQKWSVHDISMLLKVLFMAQKREFNYNFEHKIFQSMLLMEFGFQIGDRYCTLNLPWSAESGWCFLFHNNSITKSNKVFWTPVNYGILLKVNMKNTLSWYIYYQILIKSIMPIISDTEKVCKIKWKQKRIE